jgi:hypothetical protein
MKFFRSATEAINAAVFVVVVVIPLLLGYVCIITAIAARAQEHRHPQKDAPIHERFYNTWMRPDDRTISCCDLQDCYPAEFKNEGGTWFFRRREDGEWMVIPASKFESERDNPDGRNHICARKTGEMWLVFCAILGHGA